MCGICGILNFNKLNKADPVLAHRMCQKMIHRGPDGEGFYFDENLGFGHRRLSIIDLAGGSQPMANEDGTIWIVQNGEIYNYVELTKMLKVKGHKFKTQSDTEVIIHLYEEYGENCLKYLNGMFAFAIWDKKKARLFCARDRLGIKPFYYYKDKKRVVFASEIKAILCDDEVKRVPNRRAIAQYLSHMYTLDDGTFFKNIFKLLPGHCLTIEGGMLSVKQYWDVKYGEYFTGPEEKIISGLKELMRDSVRIHLRSDVPVGAHLSGGLDSSSIVALAAPELSSRLKTFSGAFEVKGNYDEREFIRLMVDRYKTDHYEIVPSAKDYIEALPKMVWHMDEPSIGSAVICHYLLCRLVSQHVKVVMGGQGGDEIFGGYYRYFSGYLKDFARAFLAGKIPPGDAAKTIVNFSRHLRTVGFNNAFLKIKRRRGLMELIRPEYFEGEELDKQSKPNGSLESFLYWDVKNYLPGLLQIEDRTSMAVSVESRIPLLDYRLVEFMAKVPPHIKMKDLILKYMEREAMRDLLPGKIVNRKDKMGFYAPVAVWFKRELRPYVEDVIYSKSFKERELFDMEKVKAKVDSYFSGGPDFSEQLWMLINIELWYRIFIDREGAFT